MFVVKARNNEKIYILFFNHLHLLMRFRLVRPAADLYNSTP